ncbi:MAG: citrate lyase ACP [Candidatus Cloacimonadota bacterium]|nr:MAG: citrate lyase ACP [Candidatus Cloacimonadota bacterium]
MNRVSTVGIMGSKLRSDCNISLKITDLGGIRINLKSKVAVEYGRSIMALVKDELEFFDIKNAEIEIEDFGALAFVLSARIETAVRRCFPDTKKEFLPEFSDKCLYKTSRERFRRSRLYVPGNFPKLMINAGLYGADGIILDLEDSVAPTEKDAAQILVRNALRRIDFHNAERMVRINQIPRGLDDLKFIVPHNLHLILIPKCEHPEQIHQVNEKIKEIMEAKGLKEEIYLMPIIESALGVLNAYEIASCADNVVALAIGLEDYTADIGTKRTNEGKESIWARMRLVNAAVAAGVQPIDTVFSDVTDMQGLRESVLEAKSLGFVGKGCIHPRQIKVIHKAFAPTPEEIEKAKKIVLAYESAKKKGLAVISLGSKMIDPPVVKRAIRTVELAKNNNLLDRDWRNNE